MLRVLVLITLIATVLLPVDAPAGEITFYRFLHTFACDGSNRWAAFRPEPVPVDQPLWIQSTSTFVWRATEPITQMWAQVYIGATSNSSAYTNSDHGEDGDNHTASLLKVLTLETDARASYAGGLRLQPYRNLHVYGWCLGGGSITTDVGIFYSVTP
jgi:hypothetical protein